MVTKTVSKHPKSLVEVNITVPWMDVSAKWDEILKKRALETEIQGFRKGQAPLEMVERALGQSLEQEVANSAMPQALIEALKGTDVVPIDYPQYQLVSFGKNRDLVFRAQVTQRPEVEVGDYRAIRVARPSARVVTEEEISKVIDDLFKRWKVRQPQGQVGQSVPDARSTSGSLNFGGGGSSVSNPGPSLGIDEPNDEFARAMGVQSLADLRLKMRTDLENEAKFNSELDYEELILQEVAKITKADVPDVLVQDDLNRMLVSMQRRVTEAGLLFDDYLKRQGKTLEQLKNELRPQAEMNVKMELGLSEVARRENVVVSDKELQDEIDKIQDARVKAQFQYPEPKVHLKYTLRQTKTLELLKTILPSI